MAKGEVNLIRKDIPLSEIERRIKALEKSGRVLKRLFFIRFRYQGTQWKKLHKRSTSPRN